MKNGIRNALGLAVFSVMSVDSALAAAPASTMAQLAQRLDALERKYQLLVDKNEIEDLQRIYGYYIERGDLDQVPALFSSAANVTLDMSGRVRTGPAEIRKSFSSATPFGVMTPGTKPKDYLHITAPISGVVDVAADGRTAKGRWYAMMFLNDAGMGGGAVWGIGVYENEYVKEDGKWKISRLGFDDIILSSYDKKGWINSMPSNATGTFTRTARGRSEATPFGDIMPYHYPNPVSGK